MTFETTRLYPHTPDTVFAAFSTPERLARWWGPAGFRNTFTRCDFVPGGRWIFTMHGPDGKDYPNESIFAAIEENARILVDHVCEPRFQLDIRLHPHGTGTRVEWLADFENKAFAQAMASFLQSSNDQNLDRLAAELARG